MVNPTVKEQNQKKNAKIFLIIGIVLYIYVVLFLLHFSALYAVRGRMSTSDVVNKALVAVFIHPGEILPISGQTIFYIFIATLAAGTVGVIAIAEKKLKAHDNPDTVNGEAHLMNSAELKAYNRKFSAPLGQERNDGPENMIISQDIRLAIDNRGTRRNCNILVIGGSGAGKSRFFASPNILQYNCNFVITDPSGEMLRDYGKALEDNGYAVKVFNLTDVYRSNRYNPFHYIYEEKDVFILVNTLIKNTTPSEGHSGDPFWENSEKLLLSALILYLWHTARYEYVDPKSGRLRHDQTFKKVLWLVGQAEVDENNPDMESPLDRLFEDLALEDPENLAVSQYRRFKIGAGKTLKSILISVGVRLQSFDLSDISYLTETDDFEFERFADTKQALFVIIPTADTTFNFIVSLLYSQLFATLYNYCETTAEFAWKASIDPLTNIKVIHAKSEEESKKAEKAIRKYVAKVKQGTVIKHDKVKKLYRVFTKDGKTQVGWRGSKEEARRFQEQLKNITIERCGARCPVHVRLILDEFANIGQIPDFDQKLATMRKYEISCSIILQALSQLKDLYKDKWNTIVGNCDTKLFLGSDDSETIKWLLEMLGKKTTTVQSTSYQAKGQGSTSYNKSSIEVMTVDQVSMMQDDECLVRIRGVRPHYGKKYELTKHPNYPHAKETSGAFVIPLSDEVKNRKKGPLLQRLQNGPSGDAALLEMKKPQTSDPKFKQAPPKPFTKEEKIERDRKNKIRQDQAKEAGKALRNGEYEPGDDDISDIMVMECMGFKPNANPSPTEIKEAVESLVILPEPPTDSTFNIMTT